MASCDVDSILLTGRCFQCADPRQLQIIQTQLLCQILQANNPMASCDPDTLLAAGRCFSCADDRALNIIQTQLLCEILQGGSTGQTCLLCGDGPPVDDAVCDCSIYYSLPPNAGVWVWDSVNNVWENIIAAGP